LNDFDLKICKIFCIDLYNETIVKKYIGVYKIFKGYVEGHVYRSEV
jgi:hypothetical protein